MTLDEILACFPTVTDWEDSYLVNGSQRLLADATRFQVEIILKEKLPQISFFFLAVEPEVVSCVDLVFRDSAKSRAFLDEAIAFVSSRPNTRFAKTIGDFDIEVTQIQPKDAVTRYLAIRARKVGGPAGNTD